jgi:DNA repair protein RadC
MSPHGRERSESRVKRTDVPSVDAEHVRRYRISKYRVTLVREGTLPVAERVVREPADVARLMTPLVADLDREGFWVLLLDGKNKIIGINLVALGTLTACLVHSREVFKPAVVGSAAAVVLVHNHPSQQPEPSAEDVALTERLRSAGSILGIAVVDHVIVTADGRYHSLANDGGAR